MLVTEINSGRLNAKEAAQFLGVPLSSLYRFTFLKLIRYSRPTGKRIFFKLEDLEAFQDRNTSEVQVEDLT